MKELTPLQNLLFRTGAILMLAGIAVHLFSQQVSLYAYGLGALLFSLMTLKTEYTGRDYIVRRLRRQQLLGCVFFLITLVCMSMQTLQWGPLRRNEWVVALAIGCVLYLYTAWRLPAALSKSKKS